VALVRDLDVRALKLGAAVARGPADGLCLGAGSAGHVDRAVRVVSASWAGADRPATRTTRPEGVTMSAVDKIKNKVEEASGEVKEKVGKHTGDKDLQAEGKTDQTKGNLKDAGENVKDAFKS